MGAVERLDLEGIVAKRLRDPYTPDTVWRKIRNGAYTQMEGRGVVLPEAVLTRLGTTPYLGKPLLDTLGTAP